MTKKYISVSRTKIEKVLKYPAVKDHFNERHTAFISIMRLPCAAVQVVLKMFVQTDEIVIFGIFEHF